MNLYDRLFTDPYPGEGGADPLDTLNPNSRETLTEAKLEPALADVELGQVVQFERLGYFAVDPDDTSVYHRTVGLRDEWANIQNVGPPRRSSPADRSVAAWERWSTA